ncbi:oligopeptide transport system substrate-binding protein [Agromyces flavus]|uniref:Oligopeptide transport system substrate-binding protein n=1 Tax=Agromyces flavus TaxID=589382 RepID=A0A1H1NG42_9MICO|nr:ABC transporter substrate-binding protein [Agromyces flavus]MCP2369108.1 oligopeptide transport system substrate-binding protein [Agromyces flavus]GGI48588.1 ABC transporter substrate-binding protein [Agromyces flavus]SDR97279.1 oligopeptide transport system substrate-binding protein [Agromyces flavus]
MKIKRFGVAAVALAAAGVLTLAGCSTSNEPAAPEGDSTAIITVNNTEPQNPLIPTNTNEVGGGLVLQNIFAGLVYYKADGSVENDVAESIESDDAQTWTIKIRDGLTFTNGDPVNAESFVKAWNYGAALDNAQLSSYFFESIEGFSYDENVAELPGLEVVDDLTFTVKLKQPESDFPLRLGYTAYFPVPESAWEDIEAFGENPIGNGPYMLDGEGAWAHNERIDLVKNEDYDGPRAAANGGIDMILYATTDAAYADLQGGNLDVIQEIPDSAIQTFETEFEGRSVNQPAAANATLTIPDRLAHFSGEEGHLRRQAISHAINREEITDVIFNGTRTPATDFTSPVIDGYSDELEGADVLDFDAELAADLWAQADAIAPWSGSFEIQYNADGPNQGWVDAVANQLKNNLGIEAAGKPIPTFAEHRTLITERQADTAFRNGWQFDYPSMFNGLGPIYGTGAGSNDGDYSNPEFDKLLDEGASASDVEEGIEKFQQAQEILFEDLPSIPLWYTNATGAWGEQVDNVEFGWDSWPILHQITKSE